MRRASGKSKMYYCPESKKVWQLDKDNRLYIHHDMTTYGLRRKKLDLYTK